MTKGEQIKKFFRDNFFSGLLVVVPAVVSVYVFVQLLQWLYHKLIFLTFSKQLLREWMSPWVPEWAVDESIKLFETVEFLILVAAIVVLIALIGLVTKIGLVRWLFRLGERLLGKIPLVGVVYSAVKQLLESVFAGKGNFNKVVLIEFPRPGIWSMGFISRHSDEYFEKVTGKTNLSNIFIPTTPNVTTGFLIVAPAEEFIELDLTVEQAFKFIVSGGVVLPHEETAAPDEDSLIGRLRTGGKKVRPRDETGPLKKYD
jgi:uncharacterized membrane protein